MKIVGKILRLFILPVNIFAGIGFLISAYSPYISPVSYPVWACSGLAFPVFLIVNVLFFFFWLIFKRKCALVSLFFLIIGCGAIRTYIPFNLKVEPEGGEVIKLLTYNTMGMLPEEDTSGHSINPILEYLKDCRAHIICLQEFPADDKQIKKTLRPIYPYIKTLEFSGGSRIACLSKYPIISLERISYPSMNNGSALIKLKQGKDTLLLVNNHLESNKLDIHDKKIYKDILKSPDEKKVKTDGMHLLHKLTDAVAIRAPQADAIAKTLADNRMKYMLVCGDFNDSPISYAHRVIGKGLQDAFVEAGNGPGFSYNQNLFYFRIDHILVSKSFKVLACEVDRSIAASDHYPVWCLLEKRP